MRSRFSWSDVELESKMFRIRGLVFGELLNVDDDGHVDGLYV